MGGVGGRSGRVFFFLGGWGRIRGGGQGGCERRIKVFVKIYFFFFFFFGGVVGVG